MFIFNGTFLTKTGIWFSFRCCCCTLWRFMGRFSASDARKRFLAALGIGSGAVTGAITGAAIGAIKGAVTGAIKGAAAGFSSSDESFADSVELDDRLWVREGGTEELEFADEEAAGASGSSSSLRLAKVPSGQSRARGSSSAHGMSQDFGKPCARRICFFFFSISSSFPFLFPDPRVLKGANSFAVCRAISLMRISSSASVDSGLRRLLSSDCVGIGAGTILVGAWSSKSVDFLGPRRT